MRDMSSAFASLRKFWGGGCPLEGNPSIVLAKYVMRPQAAGLMWEVRDLPDAKIEWKDMGKRMVGKRNAMILMPNCSLSLIDQKWRGYDGHKNTR